MSSANGQTAEREKVKLKLAADVLTDSIALAGSGIPGPAIREAFGVAVFPNMGAAVSLGEPVGGVAVARTEQGGWSGPAFVTLAGNFSGLAADGTRDLVFVFRTQKSLDDFMRGELNPGEETSAAGDGGPAARREMSGDFRAYKRSGTVFKEFQSREGMAFDADANERYYGLKEIGPEEIFAGSVPMPANGNPLTCLMASFSGTSQVCVIS